MIYTYFDWNVLDEIEKISKITIEKQEVYRAIERYILDGKTIVPYSNAHIRDLKRGFEKNSSFISGHLETLRRLTNELLIVQYWGHDEVIWEYRNPTEFFNSSIEEDKTNPESFSELFNWDETGSLKAVMKLLESMPIDNNFLSLFEANPIFSRMFPIAKEKMTVLSFCEDLYSFGRRSKQDYALYKSLRKYINDSFDKMRTDDKLMKQLDETLSVNSSRAEMHQIAKRYYPKTKTSDNNVYILVLNTYSEIDLEGYKSDERFNNMIDDSLHTFYAAHCDYFITLDGNCRYKAQETYKKLGITTKVLSPEEYVTIISI